MNTRIFGSIATRTAIALAASAALSALSALVPPAATAAAAYQLDGGLPMYPRAKIDAKMADMPAGAIAQGVPLVMETSDSVHLVDLWYTSNAPKACTRSAQSGGVKFACPTGSIMIYTHGSTNIAFVPAMPHF